MKCYDGHPLKILSTKYRNYKISLPTFWNILVKVIFAHPRQRLLVATLVTQRHFWQHLNIAKSSSKSTLLPCCACLCFCKGRAGLCFLERAPANCHSKRPCLPLQQGLLFPWLLSERLRCYYFCILLPSITAGARAHHADAAVKSSVSAARGRARNSG